MFGSPNPLLGSPLVKGALRKMTILLVSWIVLEIGALVGMSFLLGGFSYAIVLLFFISLIGYGLAPMEEKGQSKLSWMSSTRKLVSGLLMIPGYMTTVLAIVMLIGPLREFVQKSVVRMFIPSEFADMAGMLGNAGNPFMNMGDYAGMPGVNPFMDMSGQQEAEGGSKKRRVRKTAESDDVIDVDYDVKDGGARRDEIKVEVNRSNGYAENRPKALAGEDIIEVEHEWK